MALREKQTDPSGKVWYGQFLTYGRIAAWLDGAVTARTVRRWMAELTKAGIVDAQIAPMRQGMYLRLAFGAAREFRHQQLPLFDNLWKSSGKNAKHPKNIDEKLQNAAEPLKIIGKTGDIGKFSVGTSPDKNGVLVRSQMAAVKQYKPQLQIQNPREKDSRVPASCGKLAANAKPAVSIAEHRRRIEERNHRIATELLARQAAYVGCAPGSEQFLPPLSFRRIEHADLRAEIVRLAEKLAMGP